MRRLLFLVPLLFANWAYASCELKADTAATIKLGPFLDSTDGVTAETALDIDAADVRLSKNGANMAAKNDATDNAAHDELGYYDIDIDATDTNTEGRLLVAVTETGAVPVWQECTVLGANFYDAKYGVTDLVTNRDIGLLFKSTIATVNTQTSFDMDDSIAVDDTWIGNEVTIEDADNATTSQTKYVNDVDAANNRIIIDSDPGFTVATTDIVRVYAKRHPAFDVFAQLGVYDAATSDYVLALAQLQARSDAGIKADRSTELAELNADQDSGAGTYDNETDSQEAADADRVTAQADLDLLTGTDGATLATSQPNYAVSTFDATSDTVDVGAINGNATSAQQLALSAATIESGEAEGTPSITVIQTNLAETQDDIYIGAVVIFTSGDARGERTSVTDYVGSTGTLTVVALANAPAAGDTFIII
jgi:hypothetical protein